MLTLAGCKSDDSAEAPPADQLSQAVEATLSGGPVAVAVSTESPEGTNVVDGSLDPEPAVRVDSGSGLRICGEITQALVPGGLGEGGRLHIAAQEGNYTSVIKFEPASGERSSLPDLGGSDCGPSGWFDDHPPTLALFENDPFARPRYPEGAETGAENYMQMALLVLAEFDRGAGEIRALDEQTYEVGFDFPAADQVPKGRSEDRWVVGPLVRKTGERQVSFVVADGHLASLSFEAPGMLAGNSAGNVRVELVLGDPGSGEPVPLAEVTAME